MQNNNLSAMEYKELSPIARKIDALNNGLPKILEAEQKLKEKKEAFFSKQNFKGKASQYYILGILGLAVLAFDVLIGLNTLLQFAKFLGISVLVFSILFAIIDTTISIFASGNLASNKGSKFKHKKIFRKILELLGLIKLTLFLSFMLSYPDLNILSMIMDSLFVVLIYTIFHFVGAGLIYILRIIVFGIQEFMMTNTEQYQNKINYLCKKFIIRCKDMDIDVNKGFSELNLEQICQNK